MIRNTEELERFEREYQRSERPDFLRNLQIFEALWEEGVALGILPLKDPLEGLETKILLARALNVSTPVGNDCEGT
jgi:hypothetical protein